MKEKEKIYDKNIVNNTSIQINYTLSEQKHRMAKDIKEGNIHDVLNILFSELNKEKDK